MSQILLGVVLLVVIAPAALASDDVDWDRLARQPTALHYVALGVAEAQKFNCPAAFEFRQSRLPPGGFHINISCPDVLDGFIMTVSFREEEDGYLIPFGLSVTP